MKDKEYSVFSFLYSQSSHCFTSDFQSLQRAISRACDHQTAYHSSFFIIHCHDTSLYMIFLIYAVSVFRSHRTIFWHLFEKYRINGSCWHKQCKVFFSDSSCFWFSYKWCLLDRTQIWPNKPTFITVKLLLVATTFGSQKLWRQQLPQVPPASSTYSCWKINHSRVLYANTQYVSSAASGGLAFTICSLQGTKPCSKSPDPLSVKLQSLKMPMVTGKAFSVVSTCEKWDCFCSRSDQLLEFGW